MAGREPKLNMESGAFSPRIVAFERELADVLTALDDARLPEHVNLAATAPHGFMDDDHFEDPAVYSLLAYGVPGVLALESLHARSQKLTDTAGWKTAPALAAVATGHADIAEAHVWLAYRYPHLSDAAFEKLNERVRTTCGSAVAQGAAREAIIRIATRMKNDPVELGAFIERVTMGLKADAERARVWIVKSISRDREPFGIAFAKRHAADDLAEMLAAVTPARPLSFAFFDMNGLKAINDVSGHAAGDLAIRTFLEAVAHVVQTRGTVYRGEGGDEVLVALPNTGMGAARDVVIGVLRELWNRALPADFPVTHLTASCGLAVTENSSMSPDDLQAEADRQMYKAKNAGRDASARRSAIAAAGLDVEVLRF